MAGDSFKTFNVWNSDVNTVITIMTYLSSVCFLFVFCCSSVTGGIYFQCTNPITYCFLNNKFRQAFIMSFGCRKAALRHHMHKASAPNSAVYQNPNAAPAVKPQNGTRKMSPANNTLLGRCHPRPKDRVGVGRLAAVEERRSSVPVEACGLLAKHDNRNSSPERELASERGKADRPAVELRRTAGSADDMLDRTHSTPLRKESAV